MRNLRFGTKGFSLPELLVAIGIIILSLALLLPALARARRAARSAACLANLQQLAQSFQAYVNDNNGRTSPEVTDTRSWVTA